MRHLLRGAVGIAFLLYPFFVAYSLSQGQFIWVSCLLIILGVFRLVGKSNHLIWPLAGFSILCGGLSLLLKNQQWLMLYPVFMSLGALLIFAMTLLKPPSMIERFARITQADLPESGVIWTRKVTMLWCGFFSLNACIALFTVFYADLWLWTLYNGLISYLLMGTLLLGEFIFRKFHQRKNTASH